MNDINDIDTTRKTQFFRVSCSARGGRERLPPSNRKRNERERERPSFAPRICYHVYRCPVAYVGKTYLSLPFCPTIGHERGRQCPDSKGHFGLFTLPPAGLSDGTSRFHPSLYIVRRCSWITPDTRPQRSSPRALAYTHAGSRSIPRLRKSARKLYTRARKVSTANDKRDHPFQRVTNPPGEFFPKLQQESQPGMPLGRSGRSTVQKLQRPTRKGGGKAAE